MSQAPTVSSSRTSAISNFTVFGRSSCGVTASESDSSVFTLAAVQDPPGRNSSTSAVGVAVNRVAVAKTCIPLQIEHFFYEPQRAAHVDLPQTGNGRYAVEANQ